MRVCETGPIARAIRTIPGPAGLRPWCLPRRPEHREPSRRNRAASVRQAWSVRSGGCLKRRPWSARFGWYLKLRRDLGFRCRTAMIEKRIWMMPSRQRPSPSMPQSDRPVLRPVPRGSVVVVAPALERGRAVCEVSFKPRTVRSSHKRTANSSGEIEAMHVLPGLSKFRSALGRVSG